MPDITRWQDHLWAGYCLQHMDDGDVEHQDYDGELYPVLSPEPEVPVSAELAALIEDQAADLADRKRRGQQFHEAFDAGNTELALAAIHPDVQADPERLDALIELAKRMVPQPEPPERPFQKPVLWPDHPAANKNGYVSHGPQFHGEQVTPLERIHELFREKARLLLQEASLEGRPGNIAGALGPATDARMQEIETGITVAARLLGLDASTLHEMELKYVSAAQRQLQMAQKAREQQPLMTVTPRYPARCWPTGP
jgi:hypothetical protein